MQISPEKPMIEQVESALRSRIRDRIYLPGERLPSELTLTENFGVSRATVRTVLTRLANEGLIVRRQGDGTYVNQRVGEVSSLGGLLDYGRLITESGYKPTIQPVSIMHRAATEEEANLLNLTVGDPVVVLVRLFLADERPFILATNIIPQTLFTSDADFYDGRLSLQKFLQQYCQHTIDYAIYEIQPVLANDETTARLLECPPDHLLLQFSTTFYNNADQPIVWGQSAYDDSVVKLRFMQGWG